MHDNINTSLNATDGWLIPHKAFSEAGERLEKHYQAKIAGSAEPICIAIIGESRTGKTRVLETFHEMHPSSRSETGEVIPVLRSLIPANPSIKGLASTLLSDLNDPRFDKGTEISMTHRLKKLFKNCGVQVLILDELQHFIDRNKHMALHVSDWLKNLVGETNVMLVVSGLPQALDVINYNEQLDGRFLAPCIMPRFNWNEPTLRSEFKGILYGFHQMLKEQGYDTPKLYEDAMAFRFYCATGGLMGLLVKLLKMLHMNALRADGNKVIGLAELHQAHIEAIRDAKHYPFTEGFDSNQNAQDKALSIGVAKPKPPTSRKSRAVRAAKEILDV